jgi:coenzyme F420-reducing hydrogenase beta subunit
MITCLHDKNLLHEKNIIKNHLNLDIIDYKNFNISKYF